MSCPHRNRPHFGTYCRPAAALNSEAYYQELLASDAHHDAQGERIAASLLRSDKSAAETAAFIREMGTWDLPTAESRALADRLG